MNKRLADIARGVLATFPKDWAGTETAQSFATTPELKEIAMSALKANSRNWDGAKDAVYKAVRDDATLLWDLFAPYRAVAVQKLLTEVAAELRAAQPGGGHSTDARHASTASARPAPAPAPPQLNAGMAAVAAVTRLSLLDTFKANGKPIGDLTPHEANRWAGLRERDARFVRLLTANLPPDQPIRKFRTAEDTEALYEQAKDANDE